MYQLEGFTTEHCRPPSADGVGTAVWFMAHHQHIIPKAPITHLYRSASAFDLTESLSTLSPELTHGPLPLEWGWIWSPWPPLSPFPCTAVTHIQCPPHSLSHSALEHWFLMAALHHLMLEMLHLFEMPNERRKSLDIMKLCHTIICSEFNILFHLWGKFYFWLILCISLH